MSTIGIDLGYSSIKVSKWNNDLRSTRGNGPEMVENDRGKKMSSAMLSFKDLMANVCEQKRINITRNYSNYIWGLKPVLGSNDLCGREKPEKYTVKGEDRAVYSIEYKKKKYELDAETAMNIILQYLLFTAVKTEKMTYETFPMCLPEIVAIPKNIVIAIPPYYTASHIRGLEIALRMKEMANAVFLPENVAVALEYGYYKYTKDYKGDAYVLFCDMGSYCTTVTIVKYSQNVMTILGSEYKRIGGNNYDQAIAKDLRERCEKQFEFDGPDEIRDYKLGVSAEKAKIELSAGDETRPTLESITKDDSFDMVYTKEDYAIACKNDNLYDELYHLVGDVLEKYCEKINLASVEVTGCSMLAPRVREEVLKALQHHNQPIISFERMCLNSVFNGYDKISSTLPTDEACSRGCSLFAELYLNEKVIQCTSDAVEVKGKDGGMLCSMNVCCCGVVKSDVVVAGNVFVIKGNQVIEEGKNHDYDVILKEGNAFLDVFEKISREYHEKQEASQDLEKHYMQLNTYITTCRTQKPEKSVECDKDAEYLKSIESLVRNENSLQEVKKYNEVILLLKEKIKKYQDLLSIQSKKKYKDDYCYEGIWMNGKMTGVFRVSNNVKRIKYDAEFTNGKLNGKMTVYNFDTNTIKSIQFYSNDALNGLFISYYDDGQIQCKCNYLNTKKEGYYYNYYENGMLEEEGFIKEGKYVYIHVYYRNGNIAYKHTFNDEGLVIHSVEYNRKGELVFEGKMCGCLYDGKGILYYHDLYYLKCKFDMGSLMKDGRIIENKEYNMKELDKQYEETQALNTEVLPWRRISCYEADMAGRRSRVLKYMKKEHTVMEIEYKTKFDLMKEAFGNGPIIENVKGTAVELSKEEVLRKSIYNGDMAEYCLMEYTLGGDLIKCVLFNGEVVMMKEFYTSGRVKRENEVEDFKGCRIKSEGEIKDNKKCGHWVEYYNNGKKMREYTYVNGKVTNEKKYVNTGAELM